MKRRHTVFSILGSTCWSKSRRCHTVLVPQFSATGRHRSRSIMLPPAIPRERRFVDYIIGDRWTLPLSDHQFFCEKVATIPHSWFAHDSTVTISPHVPSRAEEGLPEHGFVFCCFNNSYKIMPEFFAIWMRLLREIDGSVLWLARNNDFAVANLRRAASRGRHRSRPAGLCASAAGDRRSSGAAPTGRSVFGYAAV